MAEDAADRRDIARLNAFTDGVLVVSMTLLILNVELPDNIEKLDGWPLIEALHALWPKYLGYLLSFIVIAQYWMGYTQQFGRMQAADSGFAWLNIFFLLFIGFIPFVTTLISDNDGGVATSLYAATMVAVALILIRMWYYAADKGFVESKYPPKERWRDVAAWIQIAAIFAISIVVAQFHAQAAKLMWLLLMVPFDRWAVGRVTG
jgi:uncharacterized membrane protein